MKKKGSLKKKSPPPNLNPDSILNTILLYEGQLRDIASRMHGDIGQSLVALKIKIESLSKGEWDKEFDGIKRLTEDIINDMKFYLSELSPSLLYDFGLIPALHWLCERLNGTGIVNIFFKSTDMSLSVDEPLSIILYSATKNLIKNVIELLKPNRVSLETKRKGEDIVINCLVNTTIDKEEMQCFFQKGDMPIIKSWLRDLKGDLYCCIEGDGCYSIILYCPVNLKLPS